MPVGAQMIKSPNGTRYRFTGPIQPACNIANISFFANHGSETDPSIASVELVGSWDNFSACYTMHRDARRGRGHWRGCHAFNTNTLTDLNGHRYKTDTGLAMGHTYYYYVRHSLFFGFCFSSRSFSLFFLVVRLLSSPLRVVTLLSFFFCIMALVPARRLMPAPAAQYQVNGSTEAHDPIRPTTTACPFLPGQVVNELYIPVERSLRQRSASLTSLDQDAIRTMDPKSKFLTPQPDQDVIAADRQGAATSTVRSVGTAVPAFAPFVVTSTPAPKSSWRRFLARKLSRQDISIAQDPNEERGRQPTQYERSMLSASSSNYDGTSTRTSDFDTYTRSVSPSSLCRITSHDLSPRSSIDQASLIPDITEEDDLDDFEDDANFATSVTAEQAMYTTRLSPPPFKRCASSDSEPTTTLNSSALTLIPVKPQTAHQNSDLAMSPTSTTTNTVPTLETNTTNPRWSLSYTSSAANSPVSPQSLSAEFPSFYHTDGDDNDNDNEEDDECDPFDNSRSVLYTGYSLPPSSYDEKSKLGGRFLSSTSPRFANVNDSPQLGPASGATVQSTAAAAAAAATAGGMDFLGADSLDVGLDDFASEMGWLADSITRQS